MMKKITRTVFVALLCLLLGGCQGTGSSTGAGANADTNASTNAGVSASVGAGANADTNAEDKRADKETDNSGNPEIGGLSLIAATDLHYLSPRLTDNGEAFTRMLSKSDGKMTEYTTQLTDAFLAEVVAAKPDALVLSGDLSFNGEKQSHTELAEKLAEVRAQGIPVVVLPGNHDIHYPFSLRYEGGEMYGTANVSPEEFEEIYQDMGYNQALSRDENSLSYVYPLSNRVRLLLLDANTMEKPGSITEDTLLWARQQLDEARDAGVIVIGVTHQNAKLHNDLFTRGYRIGNFNKIGELYGEYRVPLNLSGHIHVQHIVRGTDFCEAVTGSLAVSPNLYALVDISEQGDISYQTRQTDVAGWAKAMGDDTPELLNFEAVALEHFERQNSGKIMGELEYLDITDSQREDMGRFVAEVNRLYFSGRLWAHKEELKQRESWMLAQNLGEEFFLKEYLDSMMDGGTKPDNELFIPADSYRNKTE